MNSTILRFEPVKKLSTQITSFPASSSLPQRCRPRNPLQRQLIPRRPKRWHMPLWRQTGPPGKPIRRQRKWPKGNASVPQGAPHVKEKKRIGGPPENNTIRNSLAYLSQGSGSFSLKCGTRAEGMISSASGHCLNAFGSLGKEQRQARLLESDHKWQMGLNRFISL